MTQQFAQLVANGAQQAQALVKQRQRLLSLWGRVRIESPTSDRDISFLRLNDGPWYRLETRITFATLVPEDPMNAGEQAARIYAEASGQLLPLPVQGLRVGAANRLYLRTRDIAGTFQRFAARLWPANQSQRGPPCSRSFPATP